MGLHGPAAKPQAIRKLESRDKKHKNRHEPKFRIKRLRPPSWLPKYALEEWKRVVPALEHIGMLTEVDETAMVNYVVAYDRFRLAQKIIEVEGFTCETKFGGLKKRPELNVIAEAQATMKRFADAFGLTPASRSKLHIFPAKEDADADFLFGGKDNSLSKPGPKVSKNRMIQ